ncbi:hypothetical protein Q5752_007058 [Cryptotrichosporon argae]
MFSASSLPRVLHAHPAALPLGLSLLTTTAILFGNAGLSAAGPLPIIDGTLGPLGVPLSARQKVGVWAKFFRRAAILVVGGTALTTLSSLLAAYLTPSASVRWLALTSAAASASVIGYTIPVLGPTNARLLALDAAQAGFSPAEDREAEALIVKWNRRHVVRFAFFGIANFAALAASYVERPF